MNRMLLRTHLIVHVLKQVKWHLFSLLILILVGTMVFSILEGWTLIISFYFTIVTLSTVGYGDFVPRHDASRLVSSLIVLAGYLFSHYHSNEWPNKS